MYFQFNVLIRDKSAQHPIVTVCLDDRLNISMWDDHTDV